MVANVARLRALYHGRLLALGRLDDALVHRAEDDTLYAALRRSKAGLAAVGDKGFWRSQPGSGCLI